MSDKKKVKTVSEPEVVTTTTTVAVEPVLDEGIKKTLKKTQEKMDHFLGDAKKRPPVPVSGDFSAPTPGGLLAEDGTAPDTERATKTVPFIDKGPLTEAFPLVIYKTRSNNNRYRTDYHGLDGANITFENLKKLSSKLRVYQYVFGEGKKVVITDDIGKITMDDRSDSWRTYYGDDSGEKDALLVAIGSFVKIGYNFHGANLIIDSDVEVSSITDSYIGPDFDKRVKYGDEDRYIYRRQIKAHHVNASTIVDSTLTDINSVMYSSITGTHLVGKLNIKHSVMKNSWLEVTNYSEVDYLYLDNISIEANTIQADTHYRKNLVALSRHQRVQFCVKNENVYLGHQTAIGTFSYGNANFAYLYSSGQVEDGSQNKAGDKPALLVTPYYNDGNGDGALLVSDKQMFVAMSSRVARVEPAMDAGHPELNKLFSDYSEADNNQPPHRYYSAERPISHTRSVIRDSLHENIQSRLRIIRLIDNAKAIMGPYIQPVFIKRPGLSTDFEF